MEKIKIKIVNKKAVIPKQATEFAGGWDVVATEVIKQSDDFVICNLGFELEIPNSKELVLVPRSSLTSTHWTLQNSPGQGDPDFRGEYQYRFRALPTGVNKMSWIDEDHPIPQEVLELTYPDFPYKVGERIGQVYLRDIIPIEWEEVEELDETKRGSGGYGHTGKD